MHFANFLRESSSGPRSLTPSTNEQGSKQMSPAVGIVNGSPRDIDLDKHRAGKACNHCRSKKIKVSLPIPCCGYQLIFSAMRMIRVQIAFELDRCVNIDLL